MLMVDGSADFGAEHAVPLAGLDANAVSKALEDLVKKGESMPRYSLHCLFGLWLVLLGALFGAA